MLVARFWTPVALITLLWPVAVLGQDIRPLHADRDQGPGYASSGLDAAAQIQTALTLIDELKLLLNLNGSGKPQIQDIQVATADPRTPVRFRFRVGMFIEDVTLNMLNLFSQYRDKPTCVNAKVLEDELKKNGGAVLARQTAAIRKRCTA